MVIPQKIFPIVEDPGIWGQACRLVLLQKAEKLSIVEKVTNAEPSNIQKFKYTLGVWESESVWFLESWFEV